jgi:hypothetical protein
MIAKLGYIPSEIFGVFLHERTQGEDPGVNRIQKNSNANLNPQSPRDQKKSFLLVCNWAGEKEE